MGIFDIFTNTNAQDAANAQIQGLQTGYQDLTTQFNQGRDALTTNYGAALQPFLQAQQTGQQGTTAYGNALGLNGPAGNASATQAFWNNPAIASQLQVGSENVLRNNAATGQLDSGKTNVDLQNLGQQTASQGWGNYVNSLQPYLNYGLGAASGGAGVQTGLGSALNQSYTNQGNAAFGVATGQANAQANADLANNQASANIWGAVMNGAKLATSAAAMFSDERLKEDIKPVGELFDGQNVYAYRYKGDPTPRIGLMAQEVEKRTPEAVVEIGGYKAVDYGKATQYASDLARFLEAA
jgi:hypothetical protein